jgi:hypothetical protein
MFIFRYICIRLPSDKSLPTVKTSPIAVRVPLHDKDPPAADHEPAAGLLGDRRRKSGAGQGGRAASRDTACSQIGSSK